MMRKKAKSNEVTEKDVARAKRKAFFGKIRKTIKNLIKDAPQIGAFGMTSIGKFFFESIVLCFFAAFLMISFYVIPCALVIGARKYAELSKNKLK